MGISVWLSTFTARFMALLFLFSTGMSAELAPAPSAPPEPQITGSVTQELKIMTFNVWVAGEGDLSFINRRAAVGETIRAEMPDSVGLQEANEFWRYMLLWDLRDDYAIAGNLGRDFGFWEGTPILYLREKYRLIDQGVFWLNEHPVLPNIKDSWKATLRRVAAWALLEDKETGFVYLHVNTHLDNLSELARANGAALITAFIQKINLPTVLTGDMNCSPTSTPIQYYEQGGMTHVKTLAESVDGARTFHGFKEVDVNTGTPIDYIFANGYLQSVQSYRVIHEQYDGHLPSDHFAVVSTLTLEN